MKFWYWPKGAKGGVQLRQGPTIDFRDGHVWVDGKQLSEEEAAPYWRCIGPFTPENTRIYIPPWWRRLWNRLRPPSPSRHLRRITKIDHENRIVTYE